MNRVAVSHFDGDPFLLNFWLHFYEKYWQDEVDKVYTTLAYNPNLISEDILNVNKGLLSKYPKIEVKFIDHPVLPESGNVISISCVSEPDILLIESDCVVFGKGIIKEYFDALDSGYDIVAASYPLIAGDLRVRLDFEGFMRNMFACKRDVFNKVEPNFYPVQLRAGTTLPRDTQILTENIDLDCFGWISLQLRLLNPNVCWIPNNNLHPSRDYDPSVYMHHKWLHIRQMSSSVIGFGTDPKRFRAWVDNDMDVIKDLFPIYKDPKSFSTWIFIKTCVFRGLMWEVFSDKESLGQLSRDYKTALDNMVVYYNIKEEVAKMSDFYRRVLNL